MSRLRRVTLTLLALAMVAGCGGEPQLTPDQIVEAFISRVQAADRSYRADLTVEIRSGHVGAAGVATWLSGSLHVAGDDFHVVMLQRLDDEHGNEIHRNEVAFVGGRLFERDAGSGRWSEARGAIVAFWAGSFDPFLGIVPADLRYVGRDDSLGEGLHRLTAPLPRAMGMRMLAAPDDPVELDIQFDDASTVVYLVDDMGLPVAATTQLGTSSLGAGTSFAMRREYAFSAWDEPIVIVPPVP